MAASTDAVAQWAEERCKRSSQRVPSANGSRWVAAQVCLATKLESTLSSGKSIRLLVLEG